MNVGVESTLALSAQCCGSRAKYTEVKELKRTHRFSTCMYGEYGKYKY